MHRSPRVRWRDPCAVPRTVEGGDSAEVGPHKGVERGRGVVHRQREAHAGQIVELNYAFFAIAESVVFVNVQDGDSGEAARRKPCD